MDRTLFYKFILAGLPLLLLMPFVFLGAEKVNVLTFAGSLLLIGYLLLILVNFETGFLLLVALRPAMDVFKGNAPGAGLNLAAMVSVAFIVLAAFYVLYRKIDFWKISSVAPFLLVLAVSGMSMFYAPSFAGSLADWLRLVSVFAVYVLARIVFTEPHQIRKLFIMMVMSSWIPLGFAYYQLLTRGISIEGEGRIVGTFLHPNAFASYLLILLLICVVQLLEKERIVPKVLAGVTAAAGMLIFVLTFSRGAWIVFVLAMMLLGVLRYRRLLGFLPLLLVVVVFAVPQVMDRIADVTEGGSHRGRSAWEWRLDTWGEIGPLVQQKPIFGSGLGMVEEQFGILTHNDYLRLLAETGVLGLLAYLFLMFSVIRQTWKDYTLSSSPVSRALNAALLALLLGFLVRQFADNTMRSTVVMMYLWIFIAVTRNYSQKSLNRV